MKMYQMTIWEQCDNVKGVALCDEPTINTRIGSFPPLSGNNFTVLVHFHSGYSQQEAIYSNNNNKKLQNHTINYILSSWWGPKQS